MTAGELLRQGLDAARAGRKTDARDLLIRVVEVEPRNELAWMWLTGLVDDLEDKIIACENVLAINPANEKVKAYLDCLLQQRIPTPSPIPREKSRDIYGKPSVAGPRPTAPKLQKAQDLLSQAEQLEYEGKFREAVQTYEQLAARTRDSQQFDHIYRQIVRLEHLQQEKIRFVPPAASILRMTFTWPLLYASLAFVQIGLNPIAHFSFLLCLGLPFVVLGSFLLSVSEVRGRHVIWQKVFLEQGSGSRFARSVLAAAGWIFVILPFALMVLNSLARLQGFQIPPEPFFR